MYKLFWNDQLVISVPRDTYKDANEMKKAFAKLLGVNVRYLRVDYIEQKEVG